MKFSIFAALTLAQAAFGAEYPITGTKVNCRKGPGESFDIVKSYKKDDKVTISCQTPGSTVSGNSIWDKTQDDCYVTDYFVKTGSSGYVADKCKDAPKPPDNGAGPIVDDYPYSGNCPQIAEEWHFYRCQCVSFVAWRINERLNIDFTNQYKGCNYGYANEWDDCAKETDVTIDNKPVPGSVAQTDNGPMGHVAWVAAVDGDKVTIEEYNYGKKLAYTTRTVDASAFRYIHIKN